jgi:hypothetical protein
MEIKARKEDWQPGNPHIRPLTWAAPILLLGLIVFGVTSFTGSVVNSDQHELLNHSGTAPK